MKISEEDWKNLQVVWNYLLIEDEMPEYADVAIVGGSGMMTDGAERAAELNKRGIVGLIIASGFSNPYLNGGRPEAELLAEIIERSGVPKNAILADSRATNTGENITRAAELLKEKGISARNVILIHKPYMTRRFLATALAAWPVPQPKFFVTSEKINLREYYDSSKAVEGENTKMMEQMLGDYERIKVYPEFGYSVKQPFSKEAEEAYQELLKSGFTSKEIKDGKA